MIFLDQQEAKDLLPRDKNQASLHQSLRVQFVKARMPAGKGKTNLLTTQRSKHGLKQTLTCSQVACRFKINI